MENPVLPSSCVTPAGTSIEVQNEWEENTHTHTQYNGGLLPDIIRLTLCYLHRGTRLNTMYRSGFLFIAYVTVYYYYYHV